MRACVRSHACVRNLGCVEVRSLFEIVRAKCVRAGVVWPVATAHVRPHFWRFLTKKKERKLGKNEENHVLMEVFSWFFPLGAIQICFLKKKIPRPKYQKEILIFWLVRMDKNTPENYPEKKKIWIYFVDLFRWR